MWIIEVTALNGHEFVRPKFFTGRSAGGRWPEYRADARHACRFPSKAATAPVLAELNALNFTCEAKAE